MDNAKAAILIIIILLFDFNFLLFVNATTHNNGKENNMVNLVPIPTAWGGYATYGDFVYTSVAPPSANQITEYDTTVERTTGQGSARIDPYVEGSENTDRELNSESISVSPGDHVVFSCYMKVQTGPSTTYYPRCGARIGIDIYGAGGRITSKQSAGSTFPPTEDDDAIGANWVADANGGAWQQRTLDFVLPATLTRDGTSTQVAPTSIICWMQCSPEGVDATAASAWFADPDLQINESPAAFSVQAALMNLQLLRR